MDGYFTENEWPKLYTAAKAMLNGNNNQPMITPQVVPAPAPVPIPAPVQPAPNVPIQPPAAVSTNNNNFNTPGDFLANIKN